ncbi:hypothetical protein ABPG77_001942 [Micractinium sp. CCAP 211/92]
MDPDCFILRMQETRDAQQTDQQEQAAPAERTWGSRKFQVWLLPLLGAIFVVTKLTGPGARPSLMVLVIAPVATALLLTLAIFSLRCAAGTPALQTLAATNTVLCTVVAIAIYHCTVWYSVLACLPAGLADKQAFSACWPCIAHALIAIRAIVHHTCFASWVCHLTPVSTHTSLRCRWRLHPKQASEGPGGAGQDGNAGNHCLLHHRG